MKTWSEEDWERILNRKSLLRSPSEGFTTSVMEQVYELAQMETEKDPAFEDLIKKASILDAPQGLTTRVMEKVELNQKEKSRQPITSKNLVFSFLGVLLLLINLSFVFENGQDVNSSFFITNSIFNIVEEFLEKPLLFCLLLSVSVLSFLDYYLRSNLRGWKKLKGEH